MFTICVALAGPPPAPSSVIATLEWLFSEKLYLSGAYDHLLDTRTQCEHNASEDVLDSGAAGYINKCVEGYVYFEKFTHSVNFKERMIIHGFCGLLLKSSDEKDADTFFESRTWLERRTVQLHTQSSQCI